jgi:hypothetical protein
VIEDPTVVGIEITALYHDKTDSTGAVRLSNEEVSERTPVFRNLAFSNLTIINAVQVATIEGLAKMPIKELRFTDVVASGAAGFDCSHAADVDMRGVRVDVKSGKPFDFKDVQGLKVDGALQPPAP